MRITDPRSHGPPIAAQGLPVLPELAAAITAATTTVTAEPLGGGPALLDAARGYWTRRGLSVPPDAVAGAPGAPVSLLALTAALGGDVLLPRPCSAWWAPQARLLGRSVHTVPTPAECGGVPDPYALLESIGRIRAKGGDPRLLVLSVADDPTATVAPPEVLHETVKAAAGEGLHIVSDETLRDTLHQPRATPEATAPDAVGPLGESPAYGTGTGPSGGTATTVKGFEDASVVVSPAEMVPENVTVVTDLAGAFLPPAWPAAVVRFPVTDRGPLLRDRVLDVLAATGGRLATPVAAAAAYALTEPAVITARLATSARSHARVAAAAYNTVRAAGALARPPQAGRHLYVDLAPLRPALGRRNIRNAQDLEDFLSARLGVPVPGGHRFGDDPAALSVRLSTAPLLGATDEERARAADMPDPLESPYTRMALALFDAVFDDLRADEDFLR